MDTSQRALHEGGLRGREREVYVCEWEDCKVSPQIETILPSINSAMNFSQEEKIYSIIPCRMTRFWCLQQGTWVEEHEHATQKGEEWEVYSVGLEISEACIIAYKTSYRGQEFVEVWPYKLKQSNVSLYMRQKGSWFRSKDKHASHVSTSFSTSRAWLHHMNGASRSTSQSKHQNLVKGRDASNIFLQHQDNQNEMVLHNSHKLLDY
jgi:hypothetical protein